MKKTHPKVQPKTNLLEVKLKETEDRLKRSLADYQNLEKRVESQKQVFLTLSLMSFFDKLLSSLDDFYLVYNHLQDKGLKMALNKLEEVLKSEGLEEVQTDNVSFDPHTMDCVDTATDTPKDVIHKVNKKGYKYNGQVVRPAQVVVGIKS